MPPKLISIPRSLRRPDLVRRFPRNANFRDRSGEKLHGCKILGYAGILKPHFSAWLCRCRCGRHFLVRSGHLSEPTIGCGCGRWKHRLSKTPMYYAWRSMISRCYDPGDPAYGRYGARGVRVCRRWRHSVEQFAKDMGRPKGKRVIVRIDENAGFKPGNCRWVTKQEALVRSGQLTLIEYQGERRSIPEWAKRLGVSHQALYYRVRRCREQGVDLAEAIAKTPKRRKRIKG
jgi:hypothetical protein